MTLKYFQMGNAYHSQNSKFINKELAKDDLNDPEKYNRESIASEINNTTYVYARKQVKLLDEVADMVRNCDSCTMELQSITPNGHDILIYRNNKFNKKYQIDWPVRHHDDVIRVIKDDKYEYYFTTPNTMRGYFHFEDEINQTSARVAALEAKL